MGKIGPRQRRRCSRLLPWTRLLCWGSIRLETFSAYINTLAVLSTGAVLSSRDVSLQASSPPLAQLESALPQYRLLRLLPVRRWDHPQVPWVFRLDPRTGYCIPDSVVLYLPIQLCIWVAAYLKQASPDPPEDATRTVRAPVVIDSTPLLGELTVLPYNTPDKQSNQVAKGVKRSVDSAPKSSSSREGANEPPVEDHRVLKRFLQVKGPALRPYTSWGESRLFESLCKKARPCFGHT